MLTLPPRASQWRPVCPRQCAPVRVELLVALARSCRGVTAPRGHGAQRVAPAPPGPCPPRCAQPAQQLKRRRSPPPSEFGIAIRTVGALPPHCCLLVRCSTRQHASHCFRELAALHTYSLVTPAGAPLSYVLSLRRVREQRRVSVAHEGYGGYSSPRTLRCASQPRACASRLRPLRVQARDREATPTGGRGPSSYCKRWRRRTGVEH